MNKVPRWYTKVHDRRLERSLLQYPPKASLQNPSILLHFPVCYSYTKSINCEDPFVLNSTDITSLSFKAWLVTFQPYHPKDAMMHGGTVLQNCCCLLSIPWRSAKFLRTLSRVRDFNRGNIGLENKYSIGSYPWMRFQPFAISETTAICTSCSHEVIVLAWLELSKRL